MKAAVCDDQPQALDEMKKILSQVPGIKTIHTFSDMDNFWAAIKEDIFYDVVFMDIDWKYSEKHKENETGLDYAEKLYEISPYTKLIYVTAYGMEYLEDIFFRYSNLSGFLKKPVNPEQITHIIEKIQKEASVTVGKLLIYYQGSHIAIPFHDILYLESSLHKTSIVLNQKEYLCNERLERLKQRLGSQFLNCHKSYSVNMEYIQEFRGKEILLKDQHLIPVSKARAKEAKERFFTYIGEQL